MNNKTQSQDNNQKSAESAQSADKNSHPLTTNTVNGNTPENAPPPNDTRRILLIGCLGPVVMLTCVGLAYLILTLWLGGSFWRDMDDWDPAQEPWIEVSFELPEGSAQVTLLRQNAHPFLAEYHRQIHLEFTDRPPITIDLPMNVGGSTMLNVYLTELSLPEHTGSILHLEDHWGRYLIPLENPELLNINNETDIVPGTYLGRFDGREDPLRFIPAAEAAEEAIDKVGTDE
jgi:hypothetical protein